jgi:hypothetical protein
MFSRFEVDESIDLMSLVKELILKCRFFINDDKEMENVNKGGLKHASMMSFGQIMSSMNGESFVVSTPINRWLIFQKMYILLKM